LRAASTAISSLVQPSSASGTSNGHASALSFARGSSAASVVAYARERIVPSVPITPM